MKTAKTAALIVVAVIVIALLFVWAARAHNSRVNACQERGGQVTSERESYRAHDGKKAYRTEHECHVNGVEVDEW